MCILFDSKHVCVVRSTVFGVLRFPFLFRAVHNFVYVQMSLNLFHFVMRSYHKSFQNRPGVVCVVSMARPVGCMLYYDLDVMMCAYMHARLRLRVCVYACLHVYEQVVRAN